MMRQIAAARSADVSRSTCRATSATRSRSPPGSTSAAATRADHRRRPAGPARGASSDAGDDGARAPTWSTACARRGPGRPPSSARPRRLLPPAARATEVDIPVDAGDFRLMSRRALDALRDARAGALHARTWSRGSASARCRRLRAQAERFAGRDQVSAAQDDPLRARRA